MEFKQWLIEQDPFDNSTIYYGSQYLHKSSDKGLTWEIISPDLTTNDAEKQTYGKSGGLTLDVTGAENHTTILAIAVMAILVMAPAATITIEFTYRNLLKQAEPASLVVSPADS